MATDLKALTPRETLTLIARVQRRFDIESMYDGPIDAEMQRWAAHGTIGAAELMSAGNRSADSLEYLAESTRDEGRKQLLLEQARERRENVAAFRASLAWEIR